MASKRSGSKAKSGGGAKSAKAKANRELKDLDVRKTKGVRGGQVTFSEFTISHKADKSTP